MQSRIDQIAKLLKNKNYPLTDLGLRGIGGVRKFLYPDLERLLIYGSNSGEWVTYAGSVLNTTVVEGENHLAHDAAVDLPSEGRLALQGYSYYANRISPISAILDDYVSRDFQSGTHISLDGYSILSDGVYRTGDKQLLVLSTLPVMSGDQWSVPSQFGVLQTTVLSAIKTPNPDQWDVILEDRIDTDLPMRSRIMVQASSAIHFSKIPLEMPCWLCLPITTHLQECPTIFASYIQMMTGDQVVETQFTPSSVVEIPNVGIPSRCWNTARLSQGRIDYKAGMAYLSPEKGKLSASLSFSTGFEGSKIGKWRFNLSTEFSGVLTVKVGSRSETFTLEPGIQTVSFDLPEERVYGIDLISNIPFALAEILPERPLSHITLSMMVFSQNHLGSHVMGSPVLMDMILDPSLTWMQIGKGRANAGYKTNPQYPSSGYKTPTYSFLIDLSLGLPPGESELILDPEALDVVVGLTPIFEGLESSVKYSCSLGRVDQKGFYYHPGFSCVDLIRCERLGDPGNFVEVSLPIRVLEPEIPV